MKKLKRYVGNLLLFDLSLFTVCVFFIYRISLNKEGLILLTLD